MELHAVSGHAHEQKSGSTTQVEVREASERDAQALARLGKKPVLKVCSLLSLTTSSCQCGGGGGEEAPIHGKLNSLSAAAILIHGYAGLHMHRSGDVGGDSHVSLALLATRIQIVYGGDTEICL